MSNKLNRPAIFTDKMIEAAERLFEAIAIERTLDPIVNGYKKAVLLRLQLKVSPEFQDGREDLVVLHPDHAYLLAEGDWELYLAEVEKARVAAGLHVAEADHCPLLVANHERLRAENDLLAAVSVIPRLKDLEHLGAARLEDRKKAVDLALSMLSPYVKPTQQAILDLIRKGLEEDPK